MFISGRLKIRVTSNTFDKMIRLLANCSSLVRLGLIVTSIDLANGWEKIDMYKWHAKKFTAFFVELVQRLPNLIALLVVLPGAPKSHCIVATATLEKIYRPERPCFCVQITDSLESGNPPSLPVCHRQVLAEDPKSLVGELPFHLLPHESRF